MYQMYYYKYQYKSPENKVYRIYFKDGISVTIKYSNLFGRNYAQIDSGVLTVKSFLQTFPNALDEIHDSIESFLGKHNIAEVAMPDEEKDIFSILFD